MPPSLTVVTATALETKAVARAVKGVRVIEGGIALANLGSKQLGDVVVSCGLAGGLQPQSCTGTIVVPQSVTTPSGETIACDPELSDALARVAGRFAPVVERGRLITSATLITGPARALWASRGYIAADMETGFIRSQRLAAIRVILDTPERELSEAWLKPASVLGRPQLWPQGLWLAREGPRCARLAANVLAAALRS